MKPFIEIALMVVGLVIAVAAVYVPKIDACEAVSRDVSALIAQERAEFLNSNPDSKTLQALENKLDAAKRYFALEQDGLRVGKLLKTIVDAQREAFKRYGRDFHTQEHGGRIGDVWASLLRDRGFPATLPEIQAVARYLQALKADHETVYAVAAGIPAKEETVNLVIEGLGNLQSDLERRRDNVFHHDFQGKSDPENYIKSLEEKRSSLQAMTQSSEQRARSKAGLCARYAYECRFMFWRSPACDS
jgi:hypothetical protein